MTMFLLNVYDTNTYQETGFHEFNNNDDLILSLGLQYNSVCNE